MALQIVKETSFGGQAMYWRIDTIAVYVREQKAKITIGGYLDAVTAAAGKRPATKLDIEIPFDQVSASLAYQNLIKVAYIYLKTQVDWSTALDV